MRVTEWGGPVLFLLMCVVVALRLHMNPELTQYWWWRPEGAFAGIVIALVIGWFVYFRGKGGKP
jgi:hypothetical protein